MIPQLPFALFGLGRKWHPLTKLAEGSPLRGLQEGPMPAATQPSLEQHSTSDRVTTRQDKPLDNAFSRSITNLESFHSYG
jgi:hypothetical protein